ncbi:MAG: HPF/RaiA family ribosome-associated protein [Phycisphaeraceae bacterium]
MEITIVGRHMPVTEAIERHARDKAGKLDRYYDRLAKIEIVIEKSQDGHSYDVEFIGHVGRHRPPHRQDQ